MRLTHFCLLAAILLNSWQLSPVGAAPQAAPAPDPVTALPPAPGESTAAEALQCDKPTSCDPGEVPPEIAPAPTPEPLVVIPTPTPPLVPVAPPAKTEPLRVIVAREKLALPLTDARIEVEKSKRTLKLYAGKVLVKTYRVALGSSPVGAKQSQGDGRTPEGQFYICKRNASSSSFHIFLGLSYPGLPDATRAVNSKKITWREYLLIRERLASRGTPLWRTNLGGWVGIHGGTGQTIARKKTAERGHGDWTAGCVALTDSEIEEIDAATRVGTPVTIKP